MPIGDFLIHGVYMFFICAVVLQKGMNFYRLAS